MAQELTIDQALRWTEMIADLPQRGWKRALKKSVTLVLRETRKLFSHRQTPDGTPWPKVEPLPKFKKGDIWYTGEKGTGGETGKGWRTTLKGRKTFRVIPRRIKKARQARRANTEWNRRAREIGYHAPYRKRGGAPYPALLRPQVKTLRAIMTAKTKGHVRHIDEHSAEVGSRHFVAVQQYFGAGDLKARVFFGLNQAMLRGIDEIFEAEYHKLAETAARKAARGGV